MIVTLGGLVIGLGLLAYRLVDWWPKKVNVRSMRTLLPFAFSWCYGVLLILCAGGLLGGLAGLTLWGANGVGDLALVWGVGGQGGDDVSRGTGQALTNGGHAVVLITAFIVVALLRKRSVDTQELLMGLGSGICLGLVKGVAGAAAVPLASVANLAGAWMSTRTLT